MSISCRTHALDHGEPLAGSAPHAVGWVLVERPGAWGREALDLPAGPSAGGGAGRLGRLVAALGTGVGSGPDKLPVRLQAIRRPGGYAAGGARGRVVLAHAGRHPWYEVVDDPDGLDPHVLADAARATAGSVPPGLGRDGAEPLLLVCTHASRDRCCAEVGRPVASVLSALYPGQVWETSHTGGHRFAGNLVVLPDGLAYGRLDVAAAVEVVRRHLDGRLTLTHLRGRSRLTPPRQAAEVLLRQRLGLAGIRDEVDVDDDPDGGETPRLRARLGSRSWTGQVRRVPLGAAYPQSCRADEPEDPGRFELVDEDATA